MSVKPEDVTVHTEDMPGKDGKEGLVKLMGEGRVEVNNWKLATHQARESIKKTAFELGVKDVYYFKQTRDMGSDNSYEVTVEAWYDPTTIEKN